MRSKQDVLSSIIAASKDNEGFSLMGLLVGTVQYRVEKAEKGSSIQIIRITFLSLSLLCFYVSVCLENYSTPIQTN